MYYRSSNPRTSHQSIAYSESSKITISSEFSESTDSGVTFKKESNQNNVLSPSTFEITSVNITSTDSVLNVTNYGNDDDDANVSVTSPFPVAPPLPTIALKKSKQKVSTEHYSTKHALVTTHKDVHTTPTQANTSPQSSKGSQAGTVPIATPSSRRKNKRGRGNRKKNRMNKNGGQESSTKERRRHQISSSSLSNESKIKNRTDGTISRQHKNLTELDNTGKSTNVTSDEHNYNTGKKQSKQYRKALEYSELMTPQRDSSIQNQDESDLSLSEDFFGNDDYLTLGDDDTIYYDVDDSFIIPVESEDQNEIKDSSHQEEASCIRIPNSRCEEALLYSFTPFKRKFKEEELGIDKLNNIIRVLMRVFGMTRLPVETMPKKENVAAADRKRTRRNLARSILNPREVKTGRREDNCDMESALVFACYLSYPPCDDLHNLTEEESIGT